MLPGKRNRILRQTPVLVLKNHSPSAKPSLTCRACHATFKTAAGATNESRPLACPKCGANFHANE